LHETEALQEHSDEQERTEDARRGVKSQSDFAQAVFR
jgi:hypothetical protein